MKRDIQVTKHTVSEVTTHMEHHVHERGESWTRVPDGMISGTVTLGIDLQAIVNYLGRKALTSKRGRATGMRGDIVAIVDRSTIKRTKKGE